MQFGAGQMFMYGEPVLPLVCPFAVNVMPGTYKVAIVGPGITPEEAANLVEMVRNGMRQEWPLGIKPVEADGMAVLVYTQRDGSGKVTIMIPNRIYNRVEDLVQLQPPHLQVGVWHVAPCSLAAVLTRAATAASAADGSSCPTSLCS